MAAKRKPVAGWIEPNATPVIVCDDGTTWNLKDGEWEEFAYPVPGSAADDGSYDDPEDES